MYLSAQFYILLHLLTALNFQTELPVIVSTGCEYEELSEAMLEAVPLSIRSDIKLANLNVFYQQLQQYFSKNSRFESNCSGCGGGEVTE